MGHFYGENPYGAQINIQGVVKPCLQNIIPVSYTHLDVYKRQPVHSTDFKSLVFAEILHLP